MVGTPPTNSDQTLGFLPLRLPRHHRVGEIVIAHQVGTFPEDKDPVTKKVYIEINPSLRYAAYLSDHKFG